MPDLQDCSMTVVAVVDRPLPLRYLRTSDIASDTLSCEVDGLPVGRWVETECLCPLEVILVVGLTSALTWATMAALLAILALKSAPLESSGEPLLLD